MINRFSEKDWKIFRSKIAVMMSLLNEGAITLDDLDDFSDDLKDTIGHFAGR